jgi:hypothetical protein
MRTSERPLDYLAAIALAFAGLGVRWAAGPWLGPLQPLAPGFPMIAAASLLLGWRPAVLTAIVSYVGGQYRR